MKTKSRTEGCEGLYKKKAPLFSTGSEARRRALDMVSNREAFPFFVNIQKDEGAASPMVSYHLKIRRFHFRDYNQNKLIINQIYKIYKQTR